MSRYFSYYWNEEQLGVNADRIGAGDRPMAEYTGGSGFSERGVGPGDVVYLLNWFDGELRVLGRLSVDAVLDAAAARARIGEIYEAPEHVLEVGGTGTPIVLDAVVDDDELDELTFLLPDGTAVPPKRNPAGGIEPQTFRNVRELDAATADFFDRLLGFDIDQRFDDGPAQRWIAVLVELSDGGGESDDDDEYGAQDETVVELEFELQGSSNDVPERWVLIEHTVEDPEVLADPAGVAELTEELLSSWAAAERVDIDSTALRESLAELATRDEIPADD